MLTPFYEALHITDTVSVIIVSIALMLICGFVVTRITKRLRLPNVTAYIVAGILIGPYCLNLVPKGVVSGMDFIADIALAFIAFSTGEFFKFDTLKKSGAKVVVITVFEAVLASVLVFIMSYFVLGLELNFSIVLAALASATAPASTVMTIRQTHARGDFVDTLLQVVALDDVVGLVAYSVAISVALASATGAFHAASVLKPLAVNVLVFLLGGLFGVFLKLLLHKRSTDNRLIVSVALLFAFCGICAMLDVSPLLGCMSMGMIYINLTGDERLFQQLNYFNPPILLLFFVRSGLNFDLGALVNTSESIGATPLLVVGVLYFLVRIIGKYAGAFFGCLVTKKDKKVRNFLGLALIPQAGVAIGLAATGARTLGGEPGKALETIILASSVLYELIGPACAKLSLYLSGSYSNKLEDLAPIPEAEPGEPPKSQVELLIERIQTIQQELPKHDNPYYDDELAFTQAAEEHAAQMEAVFSGTPGPMNAVAPRRKHK
ncbi:MAG: cation:proton antiporter [Firmicutes bacterium]|nr:cation:proton antiporter [Clostridiales bacterium]MDD6296736.1 cation:proton antiporter [Bacillota bacterium]